MKTTCEVFLEKIYFRANHGVYEIERLEGNDFEVSVRMRMNLPEGVHTDQLSGTIDYSEVYERIRIQMSQPRNLLEHLSHRIGLELLLHYPQISDIELTVKKSSPKYMEDCTFSGVMLCFSRD